MNSKTKEVLEAINKAIEWYNSSQEKTIDQLLRVRDNLACNSYYLAEQVADYSKDYHKCYYIRKITIARQKNAYIKNGEAIGKAESLATEKAAKQFEDELEYEAVAQKLELLLRQTNKIIDALSQRISYLKKEKETTNNQNQT